jgi:hypothetical protein
MDTALGFGYSHSYFAHSLSGAWPYINQLKNNKGGSMRPLRTILIVMLTVFSLAGCQAMTGKTAGQNVDDAAVTSSL